MYGCNISGLAFVLGMLVRSENQWLYRDVTWQTKTCSIWSAFEPVLPLWWWPTHLSRDNLGGSTTAKLQLAVEVPSLPGMCSTRSFMSSPRGFIAKLQSLPPSLLCRFNPKLPSLLWRFAAKLHSLLRRFITKLQSLPPSLLRRFTTKLPSLLRRLTAKLQSLPRGLWMQVS